MTSNEAGGLVRAPTLGELFSNPMALSKIAHVYSAALVCGTARNIRTARDDRGECHAVCRSRTERLEAILLRGARVSDECRPDHLLRFLSGRLRDDARASCPRSAFERLRDAIVG